MTMCAKIGANTFLSANI